MSKVTDALDLLAGCREKLSESEVAPEQGALLQSSLEATYQILEPLAETHRANQSLSSDLSLAIDNLVELLLQPELPSSENLENIIAELSITPPAVINRFTVISGDNSYIEQVAHKHTHLPPHRVPAAPFIDCPTWDLPFFNQGTHIVRESLVELLNAAMKNSHADHTPESSTSTTTPAYTVLTACHGLGGVGKSHLARYYCEQNRNEYDFVGWVQGDEKTPDALKQSFVQMGKDLGLVPYDCPPEQAIPRIKRFFEQNSNWLLVVDNVQEPEELVEILPQSTEPQTHILMTTRNERWDLGNTIPVDVMSEGEAVELLQRLSGRELSDDEERQVRELAQLKTLAEKLGRLPLALAQAGSYLYNHPMLRITDYLIEYDNTETSMKRLLGYDQFRTGHTHESVTVTWLMNFEKVKEHDDVQAILSACACLHHRNIPWEVLGWFLEGAESDETDLPGTTKVRVAEALAELIRYSLIENDLDNKLLSLHVLVHQVVTWQFWNMTEPEQSTLNERAERLIRLSHALKYRGEREHRQNPEHYQKRQQHQPHQENIITRIEECLDIYKEKFDGADEVPQQLLLEKAYLFDKLGILNDDMGNYTRAKNYLEQALTIFRAILGEAHPDLAASINNLGMVCNALGEYVQAKDYLEQALVLRRTTLGKTHPDVAISLNSLGGVYYALGEYAQAKGYLEQALTIFKSILEETHPYVTMNLNNLGLVYSDMGEYARAKDYLGQALVLRKATLEETHPDVAASLLNLGKFYYALGEYAQAKDYLEQALTIFRAILGETHPNVATILNNLGVVYYALGKYPQAKDYHEQALALRRAILGEAHPDVATSLLNLGNVYYALGEYAQAKDYLEQALTIFRAILGEAHPDLAASINNLGMVCNALGEYVQAKDYLEQALVLRRATLGEAHPDVAASLNNLGLVYSDMGEYVQAKSHHQQALTIFRAILGEAHPDVAGSLNNLGMVCSDMGEYAQAKDYCEQALVILRATLGEVHSDVAIGLTNLAEMTFHLGDVEGAKQDHEKALVMLKELLPEKHIDIAWTLTDCGRVLAVIGDYDDVLAHLREALSMNEELVGNRHIYTARTLHVLGEVLNQKGDYAEAIDYLNRALDIYLAVQGERTLYAVVLTEFAKAQLAQGKFMASTGNAKQALAILEGLGYEDSNPFMVAAMELQQEIREQARNTSAGLLPGVVSDVTGSSSDDWDGGFTPSSSSLWDCSSSS